MHLELVETGRDHGSKAYRSNEQVAQKKAEGATIHEGRCCSEEETGTNDTTDTVRQGQPGRRWNDTRAGI